MGLDASKPLEVVRSPQYSYKVAGTKRSVSPGSTDEALGRANKIQATASQQVVSSSQSLLGIAESSFEERLQQWVQRADSSKQENRIEAQRRILDAQKSNAQQIDLSNLNLTEVPPLDGLTHLKGLDLSYNYLKYELKEGCFNGLNLLEELNLSNNDLSELKNGYFDALNSLKQLNLSKNNLSELKEGCFDGLNLLTYLFLSNNDLSELKKRCFDGLNSLWCLYLSKNNLRKLPKGCFNGLNLLKYLFLSKNQLRNFERMLRWAQFVTEFGSIKQ